MLGKYTDPSLIPQNCKAARHDTVGSCGEAQTGASLGLTSQPIYLNQQAPGSITDPVSKVKAEVSR